MSESIGVVITSINPPTEAIRQWADSYQTTLVADLITPVDDYLDCGVSLIGIECEDLKNTAPVRHYARKNLGYLEASRQGHDWILDTDDDTFPSPSSDPIEIIKSCTPRLITADSTFVNTFSLRLAGTLIWPRGLPLTHIHAQHVIETPPSSALSDPGIVQFFIDGDTDVDAIQRFVFSEREVQFPRMQTLDLIAPDSFSPFNSQLTLFSREVFPLLYLPKTVAFRFTDILRSVVAKRVLDRLEIGMAFADSIGYQVRNPHDLQTDFVGEWSTYTDTSRSWHLLADLPELDMRELLLESYLRLAQHDIVQKMEIHSVENWLTEV